MPSVMEDPLVKTPLRTSGQPPFLTHLSPLPVEIVPRQVTLKDRVTVATLVPFSSPRQVPPGLLAYVCLLLNREIEAGDTYPMTEPLTTEAFSNYWFGSFGAVMLLGDAESVEELLQYPNASWERHCLGSFYIKPNYPGRSSHVCNGGFLVGPLARNRGIGRLMGEGYLEWAPKLGYSYSVFNLVYETNVASCRIWDSLGFKRIGRVKGCGSLRSYPDQLVDAIQYGRDLGPEGEEYASEDRFDKIRYYLKHAKYPDGADRAEKSRLRSAATHYRIIQGATDEDDKLMLKDKEVISDPAKQQLIAKEAHEEHHAGINKTTAAIADKYHWIGIKTSVSVAIKNCSQCHDTAKPCPSVKPDESVHQRKAQPSSVTTAAATTQAPSAPSTIKLPPSQLQNHNHGLGQIQPQHQPHLHTLNHHTHNSNQGQSHSHNNHTISPNGGSLSNGVSAMPHSQNLDPMYPVDLPPDAYSAQYDMMATENNMLEQSNGMMNHRQPQQQQQQQHHQNSTHTNPHQQPRQHQQQQRQQQHQQAQALDSGYSSGPQRDFAYDPTLALDPTLTQVIPHDMNYMDHDSFP